MIEERGKLNVKLNLRVVVTFFVLILLAVSIEGNQGLSFASSSSKSEVLGNVTYTSSPSNRVFINQSFDSESVGTVPANWTVSYPQYGSITVINSTWYGSGATGKSAMITDGYADNNPVPYRLFSPQNSTVVISFAIKPTSNIGVKKTIQFYVDDGNFSGASFEFKDGQIGYESRYYGFSVLRSSYAPDRWYKAKLILNIPQNTYNIYIDDHLEQSNVAFIGTCTQISRIVLNETSGQDASTLPVAFIDEILGVQGIEIPRDYATIQDGINAANPGDLIVVTKQRTYFESITIPFGKDGIWLYGEDVNTTIIDESFIQMGGQGTIGISIYASNVRLTGLTVRSMQQGTGIVLYGSSNTIENSAIINGLGDGVDVFAPNNTITGNAIRLNLKCGVQITSSNTSVTANLIESNDLQGVLISGSYSDVEGNVIRLNLGSGVQISQGEQNLVRNNTIKKNGIGIECDASARNNLLYENRFINNSLQASNIDPTNAWDQGYPYVPDKETGGGNFWSDFNAPDIFSGTNQDQRSAVSVPTPDGICDNPYALSSSGVDRYPLFLIQNVTQDPVDPTKISYTTLVNVTATILSSVDMSDAHLEVQTDTARQNVSMTIAGNKLKASIPVFKYGTNVTYNVTAHADSSIVVRSTNYPLLGPYTVGDQSAPTITAPVTNPVAPSVNQTISVAVNVTEPQNASGVSRVYVTCWLSGTPWSADMNATGNNTYSVIIPAQVNDGTLNITVSAMDYAGNLNTRPVFSLPISKLPELTVTYKNLTYPNSCQIDEGIMARGQKLVDNNLRFNNTGGGVLNWTITLIKDGSWVKITPLNGTTVSGSSNATTITLDTTGLDVNSYAADFAVNTNGSVPYYTITVRVTVRDIVIDDSYSSIGTSGRCDINTTQFGGFHATWAHNGSDAISGKIEVKGIGWLTVNATGWANFNDISGDPVKRTYYVDDVNFTYSYINNNVSQVYLARSFTQKASNLTVIWDRVKITLAAVNGRIDVNSQASITWNGSMYESDNSPFNGTVHLNDTLFQSYVGKYYFTVSSITDNKYNLTQFRSNTVFCIWDTIEIIGGGSSRPQTSIGGTEVVWFVAVYQYDNTLFNGANGILHVDTYEYNGATQGWRLTNVGESMVWSVANDRWEKTCTFDSQGSRNFTISKVDDALYGLRTINDLAGPVTITWSSAVRSSSSGVLPVQNVGMPSWAIMAIAVTLALGMGATIIVLVRPLKSRTSKDDLKARNKQ